MKKGTFWLVFASKMELIFHLCEGTFLLFFSKNLYSGKVAAKSVPNYPPFKTVQKMSEKPPFRSITVQ